MIKRSFEVKFVLLLLLLSQISSRTSGWRSTPRGYPADFRRLLELFKIGSNHRPKPTNSRCLLFCYLRSLHDWVRRCFWQPIQILWIQRDNQAYLTELNRYTGVFSMSLRENRPELALWLWAPSDKSARSICRKQCDYSDQRHFTQNLIPGMSIDQGFDYLRWWERIETNDVKECNWWMTSEIVR